MLNSPVDEIKNKLDVIDVIGGYLRLQKAGRNYKAPCPFHNEKTPSFMVSPERQSWKCFGCGKSGSIFDFVMELEGMEFGDALRLLAQRAGVELKKTNPKIAQQIKTEKSYLYEICNLSKLFYIKQLEASITGKKIQEYLVNRGLEKETIKNWQIGYAPNQWNSLLNFLKNRGYSESQILKTGMIIQKEGGVKHYDRFRDRIMFPILDFNGLTVGFSGRENPENPNKNMGKYINTPSTLIYDKSRILYGLDKAKLNIRKNNLCILMEGQMDVVMSHQAGADNAVGSSGTALTADQLKIIKRYTDNLAMAFDMDIAGENATKKGIDLAGQIGFNTKVITVGDDKDPADCIQENKDIWLKVISEAKDFIEFAIENAFSRHSSGTIIDKKEISKLILPLIKNIPNEIESSYWIQKLSQRLKVSEKALREEIGKISDNNKNYYIQNEEKENNFMGLPIPSFEEYALGLILAYPRIIKKYQKKSSCLFSNPQAKMLFKKIKKNGVENYSKKLSAQLTDLANSLAFKAENQKELIEKFNPIQEVRFCFSQLKKHYYQRRLSELSFSISDAENKKDDNLIKKLTEEKNKLIQNYAKKNSIKA